MAELALYHLFEGEWFVRGTADVAEATKFLLADPDVAEYDDGIAEDCDLEPDVTVIRAGLFRFNPCSPRMCSEGHSWHLGFTSKPGRGVFEGVYFDRVHFVEVDFDVDYPLPA